MLKRINVNILLIFLGAFLFCFSKTENEVPDSKAAEARINVCLDSANNYLFEDNKNLKIWIDEAFRLAEVYKMWDKQVEILKDYKLTNAIYFNETVEWKNILLQIDSIIRIHRDKLSKYTEVSNLSQWGVYNAALGADITAIDLFTSAIKKIESLPKDSATCRDLYYNHLYIASVYKKLGLYEAAIQENLLSLEYFNELLGYVCNPPEVPNLSGFYCEIANAYLLSKDNSNAFKYYTKAKDNLTAFLATTPTPQIWKSNVLNVYLGLSLYYNNTEQFDKSLEALSKMQSYLDPKDPFFARNLIGIGDVHLFRKEYQKALNHYIKAKKVHCYQYGLKNYRVANANIKIAQLYENQEKWENALNYYQQAICNISLDFHDSLNYWLNPPKIVPQQIIGRTELLKALDGKVKVLWEIYKDKADIALLKNAAFASDLSISLIDSIKNDLFLDKDRQFHLVDHYPIYERAIVIAEELYKLTEDKTHLEKAMTLSEASKSLSLLAIFQAALKGNSETNSWIEKERQLKFEIAKREEVLMEQKKPLEEDSLYVELQRQYYNWIQEVKNENPNYIKFKYNTPTIPIQTIQKKLLSPNQALLEYFWGEKFLFTISVSKAKVNIYKQEIGTLADSIYLLRALALNPSWQTKIDTTIHFQALSHFIYKKLLKEPLQDLGKQCNNLILIRDGILQHLPFELLNVSEQTRPGIFLPEDFLLKQYIIAYANSASLLSLQNQLDNKNAARFFAGFAPSYEEISETANPRSNTDIQLKGATIEVTRIKNLTRGNIFEGNKASEKVFKKLASKYKILHLAMHAFANDQQPEFSELLFTRPNPDSNEDGQLRAIELYNMHLNAQMAVLSACESGYGKLQRGEGVLSLSQAFTYAGVPSIVASQWNADDNNTAIIMPDFYRYLKKGLPKDEALARAKLKFLEEHPNLAHPFYWASFIASGNMSSIEFPSPLSKYIIWGIISLFVFTLTFRRKIFPFVLNK